jgi:dihydroflavonol-4-reductase
MGLARFGAPFVTAWGRLRGAEPLYTGESLRALRANRCISAAKAERELGYAARPLAETLRAVHEWFLSTGRL